MIDFLSKRRKDLAGQKFGRLTALEIDKEKSAEMNKTYWKCFCDCGNVASVYVSKLTTGHTQSCGCLHKEVVSMKNNSNIYHLINENIAEIQVKDGRKILIDARDIELAKQYTWYISKQGYAASHENKKSAILLHRIIMNPSKNMEVDHINRNRLDCRRSNLRVCEHKDNAKNCSTAKNNSSGIIGVSRSKKRWRASICVNYNAMELGTFKTKEEAIKTRLEAESRYYGEYAPQKHLFEEYGIMGG